MAVNPNTAPRQHAAKETVQTDVFANLDTATVEAIHIANAARGMVNGPAAALTFYGSLTQEGTYTQLNTTAAAITLTTIVSEWTQLPAAIFDVILKG